MRIRYTFIAVSAAVGMLSTQVLAQPDRATSQSRRSAPRAGLSIAGAMIGMSPAEVASALETEGYVRGAPHRGPSWESDLADALSRRGVARTDRSEVIRGEGYRRGQESISVVYAPVPGGSAATLISYSVPTEGLSEAAFRSAVRARYGRPSVAFIYCSRGERQCDVIQREQPSIIVQPNNILTHTIQLAEGAVDMQNRDRLFAAEIARLAPRVERTTF